VPSRSGYSYLIGAILIVAVTFAAALRFRSWPLWLVAFGLTVLTLGVAWTVRASYVVAP
jgi:hypothetical protein